MKIEITDEIEEVVVRQWLQDVVEMAENFDGKHPEDISFWDKMRTASQWILENNWPGHVR